MSRTQEGYVVPGTVPAPGQTPLPDDLEQAAVEQIAYEGTDNTDIIGEAARLLKRWQTRARQPKCWNRSQFEADCR